MQTHDDFKEKLKAAADIRQIAFALGMNETAGRFFCPACQPTGGKSPDLVVKDGGFICHKCKEKGDVFALILLAGAAQDFPGAIKWLANETGQTRDHSCYTTAKQRNHACYTGGKQAKAREAVKGEKIARPGASWRDIFGAFLGSCRPVEDQPLAWLTTEKRIDPEVVKVLGLRFCGKEYLDVMGKLENDFGKDQVKASGLWSFYGYFKAQVGFLVIPYFQDGSPVYLKARPPISKDLAERRGIDRFRNTAGKIPCLYNIDALKSKPQRVYICEGESDTWAALTFGEAAVGSPGAGDFKSSWVESFRSFQTPEGKSTVSLVPDKDKPGKVGARTIADLFLKAGLPCPDEVKIPDPFKDLGEYLRGMSDTLKKGAT